jgi:HK97 family phage major capsid protein
MVRRLSAASFTARAPTAEQVAAVVNHNLPHFQKGNRTMRTNLKDSPVQPAHIFGGIGGGGIDVKAPSNRYSTKRYTGKHKKTGQEILRDGAPVELPSEREHALTGVYFKHLAIRAGVRECPQLNEHEQDLLKEIYNDHLWVGTIGGREIVGEKLEAVYHRKGTDLISDSLSGGTNLVPYFYDTDIVTFPLLNGELFPFIKLTEMNTSNSVHTASIGNVTANWGASEGSGNTIPLQTTDGLVSAITLNVFDISMAITIGRYLLMDTPIKLGEEINMLMGQRLTQQLDCVIAVGNGTTQPQGLTNAAGTVAVSAVNSTAGPFTVKDVENMLAALPKQYRTQNKQAVNWVMNDASWFRLRGIPVSGTDQRRIFGYDYENYTLTDHRVGVQNDIPQNDIFLCRMDLYRMYRRMGMVIEMSTQGKTLMQANELLITGRSRYAGQLVNGAGCAFMSNAPLH